jgi:hypothetical protein
MRWLTAVSTGYWPVSSGNLPDGLAVNLGKAESLRHDCASFRFVRQVAERDGRVARSTLAGERELRGEEQFPVQLPGIGAVSFGQSPCGRPPHEYEGAEVRGRGEVSGAGGGVGLGVLSQLIPRGRDTSFGFGGALRAIVRKRRNSSGLEVGFSFRSSRIVSANVG